MNERARYNENGVPPDPRAPVQNSYYFPPASYPHGAQARPQPQPFPQGYQQPGYPQPSYPQPSHAQGEPATFATIDDAVAEIAARQRALEGDPRPAMPSQSLPPQPPANPGYGPDPYAPPQYRAPAYAPPLSPYAAPAYAEAPRYAPPPPMPGPDLSGLEAHLRSITAQIETLRQPAPDFSGALRELRQDLSEIGARLTEALPRRAVEALEAEVRRLAERIDISRAAGVDSDAIAGMERSLNELRDAIRSLKPAESLAGFEQAIRNLSERIDHAAGAYQDPASLQQLEHSITALRGIVANVASNETLAGLAEEVRGLSARVERVASTSKGIDPEMLHSIEQRIANLPILGAIERGFADLQARLDSIQMPSPLPIADPAPAVDYLKRDLSRTQDSLEAVHSTLGHLVDRLAMIEGGIREARIASETPAPPSPPAPNADLSQFMQAASNAMRPASPAPVQAPAPMQGPMHAPAPETVTLPFAAQSHSPVADIRAVAMDPAPAPAAMRAEAASQPTKPKAAPPPMRERQPIDSKLPHDFPLEPGTGVPRARPNASAAERIAASEAALGSAKPGGANHPGQTNFIAAARRAAQAAAAAPEAPKAAKAAKAAAGPVAAAIAAEPQDEKPGKSISQRMRSLFVGASAVILVIAGGKLVLDMFDIGSHRTADIPAPVFTEAPEEPEAPKPQIADKPASVAPQTDPQVAPKAAPALPQAPNGFNAAPPSGVIVPERPKAQAPVAVPQAGLETTGSIGKRSVAPAEPAAAPVRDALPTLSDKLPASLRVAAAKGQPAAEYEVGTRFLDGKSVPQNAEEGVRWLERAAKSGIAPANFRLGGIYEKGLGVKKNVTLARRYYISAAERGHAKSMHNLAVLYAEGIDGKPDYKTAAEWFRRASEFGIADSQYNLGILLARGIGIEQNLTESYKWFALAALQGDRDAAQKRDDVGAKLDAASLASARAAVQSFTAQPQPDDAISVQTPPGGWDRPAADNAPAKKPRAGSVARVNAS
jgi:localization factor PodJL